ncbi:hypothetical protein OSB04_032054 [Centaurea solstitialis]|uniref:1-phosphatidylinositol 4-kinase n=1 Tax=Centaurea solstitialis TaxID=347529 RepID=A0AA38SMV9_9ASTR|nr:hypothetical protein OSB04_032054 [Centaurea solstitialis]
MKGSQISKNIGVPPEKGFAGVPSTVPVKILHKDFYHPNGYDGTIRNLKMDLLHNYVENFGNCENYGPKLFPLWDVQKIAAFDLRVANTDRPCGNILLTYLYWPKANEPLLSEVVEYVIELDAEKDIEVLRFNGWKVSTECALILKISILQKAAAKGM